MRIYVGGFLVLTALLTGIYACFTAQEKGPILSNTYLWMSEKERQKADKKAEYKLLTVIFSGLSFGFSMNAVYVFTGLRWALRLFWAAMAFVLIYALWDTVHTQVQR